MKSQQLWNHQHFHQVWQAGDLMPTSPLATHSPAHQTPVRGQGWQNWDDSLGERLPDSINPPRTWSFFSRHCLEASNGGVGAVHQGERQRCAGWCAFPRKFWSSRTKKEQERSIGLGYRTMKRRESYCRWVGMLCSGIPTWSTCSTHLCYERQLLGREGMASAHLFGFELQDLLR